MKKQNFLIKLMKEEKIKIIEPSENITLAYIEKSDKALLSAKAVAEIENYEDAVALAYYSMYYSLLALLFKIGVKCENHTGAIILLREIFDIDNTGILTAKKERVDKQYYIDFSVTEKDVKNMFIQAEEFNGNLHHFIDSLTQSKVKEYRNKLKEILK